LNILSQDSKDFTNTTFLKKLYSDKSYMELKSEIVTRFSHTPAGKWGEFVTGVNELLITKKKVIAFTFDACGGKKGSGYDKELIDFLHKERIPATLFISGRWIDAQLSAFKELCSDSLFEIENHGLNHKPCSKNLKKIYGIRSTSNIGEAFDEIEANARKIEAISHNRPHFYRSATAYMDEACASMSSRLNFTVVSYQVLSGDAVPFAPEPVIEENVLKKIVPGAIIIMHFNHPDWNTKEAMEKIVPKLRKMGYSFVLLKDFKLGPRNDRPEERTVMKAVTQPVSNISKFEKNEN
jgi:peptidoglycan/xylan/chitin deacetylase (PgdA/CDA1 family)